MTTLAHSAQLRDHSTRPGFLGAMYARWQAHLLRRKERRMMVDLSRLPPHLIRDMGFDPEQIYYELRGSWEEIAQVTFRLPMPNDLRV